MIPADSSESQLRALLEAATRDGAPLRRITTAAGVPYHRVWQWFRGGTKAVTTDTADRLFRVLREGAPRP